MYKVNINSKKIHKYSKIEKYTIKGTIILNNYNQLCHFSSKSSSKTENPHNKTRPRRTRTEPKVRSKKYLKRIRTEQSKKNMSKARREAQVQKPKQSKNNLNKK